jgi:hypothetical protein
MKSHNFATRMMSGIKFTSSLILSASVLAACAPKDSLKGPAAQYTMPVTEVAPMANKVEAPKVDVLFVIDTSESMTKHMEDVRKYIKNFSSAFDKNKQIDFHIGVVSIFDSKRFGSVVPDGKYYPLGLLRPVLDPSGKPIAGPQYITRVDHYEDILAATLNVPTENRCAPQADKKARFNCVDAGGPEFEESLSPIKAVITGNLNPGFIRPEAHFAVIIISDSNDQSIQDKNAVSPSELHSLIVNAKGGDSTMYSAYAVLAGDKCGQDPAGAPTRILNFLQRNAENPGRPYDLCEPQFGNNLADVGNVIQQKASRTRIQLARLPDRTTISVKFAGRELPADEKTGWQYLPNQNQILIGTDANLDGPAGSQLEVTFKPLQAQDMAKNRTTLLN